MAVASSGDPMQTLRPHLHRIALLVVALAAGAASGSTLDVNGVAYGESVTVAGRGSLATAEIGATLDGFRGFSYSVDLAQSVEPGASPEWTILPLDSDALIRAAWLVGTFHPEIQTLGWASDGAVGVTREAAIAALQVAIWEVMSDASGNYSLASGEFAVETGGASNDVVDLAYAYLGALANASLDRFTTKSVWVYHPTKQDQLFSGYVAQVPEPGSAELCGLGLALVALGIRSGR
jgi:hypothetical protein